MWDHGETNGIKPHNNWSQCIRMEQVKCPKVTPWLKKTFFSSMTMIISEQFHIDPLEPLGRAGSKSQFDREQC